MKNITIFLERITKHIPIIYAVLIFIGYSKLYVFYFCFNIEISEYMSLQELLLGFLSIIFILVLFGLFMLFSPIVMNQFLKSANLILTEENNVDYTNKEFVKNLKRQFYYMIVFGFIAIIGLELLLLLHNPINQLGIFFCITIPIIGICSSCGMILFSIYSITILNNIKNLKDVSNLTETIDKKCLSFNLILIPIIFYITILIDSTLKSLRIKEGNANYSVEFEHDNKYFKSDKNCLYIDVTKDYLFCYDKLNKQTLVYKLSDIKGFKIKKIE